MKERLNNDLLPRFSLGVVILFSAFVWLLCLGMVAFIALLAGGVR